MGATGSLDRNLSNAKRLAKRGDVLAAQQIYRAILTDHPANHRAAAGIAALRAPPSITPSAKTKPLLKELAKAATLARNGEFKAALSKAAPLAAPLSQYPLTHHTLGVIHQNLGQRHAAIAAFRNAVAAHPTFADARVRLAKALATEGDHAAARAHLLEGLNIDPSHTPYALELGRLLVSERREREALAVFETAVGHAPDDPSALLERGTVLSMRGAHTQAIADHTRAVDLSTDKLPPLLALAESFRRARRHSQALPVLRKALAAHPRSASLWNSLGLTLGDLGDADQARSAFQTATGLNPNQVAARVNLVLWTKGETQKGNVTEMERMLAAGLEGMNLHFGLGKALDDLGEYDRAFEHFAKGNALRRAREPYNPALLERAFDAIRQPFASGALPSWQGECDDGPTPVFMVGMPRSGSSLGENLLAAHSQVEGVGEANAAEVALEPLVDALRKGEPVDQPLLGQVRRRYRDAIAEFQTSAPVVVDKHLYNFRRLGPLAAAFPEAKFVQTKRDPMATAWSVFSYYFSGGGHNWAYDQSDIAHYFRQHVDLMAFWQDLMPGRIVRLDHEALLTQPETTMTQLLEHCGLSLEPQCLRPGAAPQIVATASGPQVRQGFITGGSQTWRRYEHHLKPLAEGLAPHTSAPAN